MLSRTINPHVDDDCNEKEHFNWIKDAEKKNEASSSNDNQQKRRMSHVDIMFIDKEDGEDKEEEDKQNGDKISPGALVDIMACENNFCS